MDRKRYVKGGKRMRAGMQAAQHPSPFACRIYHANGIHAGMPPPPHPFALLPCMCNGTVQNSGQYANWGLNGKFLMLALLLPPSDLPLNELNCL